MERRDFLTGGLGLVASAGLTRMQAQQADSAPPPPKREVPHRMVKTTNLFKAPPGHPNAVAIAPEGLWVAEQKKQNFGVGAERSPEACWLLDWNGKLLKTVLTESSNTSGMAYGDGYVWMGANGGQGGGEGIYQTDMNSRTVSHRQIPLGPVDDGGGCHGLMWHDDKLWIVANRLRGILRVDPKTWKPEFMIPITTGRWHGVAWDNGGIWMVTGTSDVDRYVERDGKLVHTTTSGLVKYDAATGQLLETAEFVEGSADPHGLAMHNGTIISCDAGIGPPGFELSHSPNGGYVFQINFI